jgi:hypothetical protein
MERWSLTSLREKLIKIGAKVISTLPCSAEGPSGVQFVLWGATFLYSAVI